MASELAQDHYNDRKQLAVNAAAHALTQWDKVDRNDIARSWLKLIPGLAAVLSAAQLASAGSADPYLDAVAPTSTVDALVSAAAFAGAAADGRSLAGLLFQPAITALQAIGKGATVERAMAGGAANLDMIVRSEVADAGRVADQVGMVARPDIPGYIRVVVGDSCNKCIILAGRWYRYSEGFARHPRCDCMMLPASQAESAKLVQDPMAIYESMTERQRTEAGWSEADQKAIDAGADINQVTNAQRSVYTAGGREFTRDSTTKRGVTRGRLKARMTPDQIFIEAGDDRDKAIELLRKHGYLTGDAKPARQNDAERAAVERQARIDAVKARAKLLAELEEIAVINEADGDVLARQVRQAAVRFGVADDEAFAEVLRHAEDGDRDLVEASIETIAERLGLTRIGGQIQSEQVIPFDRSRHSMVSGERAPKEGAFVEVVRPGYEADVDGERAVLVRAIVDNTDKRPSEPPQDVRPAEPVHPPLGDLIPRTVREARLWNKDGRVAAALRNRLDGQYAGLTVKLRNVQVDVDMLFFDASVFDADGIRVGDIERRFRRLKEPGQPEDLAAFHLLLDLHKQVQGQGFAEAWNGQLMDWYSESGFGSVHVGANIDVGGYAWARQGFDFRDESAASKVVSRLKWRLSDFAERYDDEQIATAEAILERMRKPFGGPDFPTAYEVSQAGRKPGQGRDGFWPGKDAMLGSNWAGVKSVPPRRTVGA